MIKLIYEPTVDIIGKTQFIEPADPKVFWKDFGTDGEKLAEYAGRLCYLSWNNPAGRTTPEYITNILKQGHFSVIEHASVSLLIQGISRSCSHELVRHRHFSFSQLSQRYVDESEAAFVVPPALIDLTEMSATFHEWVNSVEDSLDDYKEAVHNFMFHNEHIEDKVHRRKVAREAARSLLPNATETKMVVTGNFRAWRHFLELRTSEFADREIRRLAVDILAKLTPLAPTILSDFVLYTPADGQLAAKFEYRGA